MMRFSSVISTALLACAAMVGTAAPAAVPSNIAAAVADSNRPDADKQLDADRKPGETLAFAGVKSGESIAELISGGGYFTRVLAKAVGPKGHVYSWAPPRPADAPATLPDFAAKVKVIAADPSYANVTVVQQGMSTAFAGNPVDMIFTAQNYHDFHNFKEVDMGEFNKAVFNSLKPGGLYIVLDHSAEKGSGLRDTSTLHRIDEATVKSEVTAAGFVFVGESPLLANAADPRTAKVFDASIRHKTDQFILKFRKPKK
jgi:predicted methyltransferase